MGDIRSVLKDKIGFGTAPLGNMYRAIPEEEALATVEAAWDQGIRYFDTAPFYGAGLAEARLGDALSQHHRDDYALSTKVGRLILDEQEEKEGLFAHGRPNRVTTDYSADGTARAIEQSLERLKTDRLDFVFVHDISRDHFGDDWISKFDEARTGAFRTLARLQQEGVIAGWGLGVNTTEPIELALDMDEAAPTISLSATQYTLLNHERALQRMMPSAEEKGARIVVGGPFNSGALLGGDHYNYAEIPPRIEQRVTELTAIAEQHRISLKAAAIRFSAAHPAVAAVIPGSSRPERIAEDVSAMSADIPGAFWEELLEKGLISAGAPLPRS
ncbi:aldo/keto reductase [Nesterenkonia populi]